MALNNPTHTLRRIIRRLLSLHAEHGHPPLDIDRIDRRVHPLHVESSGERRLCSFLPQCHLSCSKLRVLTPHAMSSLHHQGPPRDLAQSNTSVLASQAEEPMLTLLASTSTRVVLHFTSRGTYVDLACIPDLAHKARNLC